MRARLVRELQQIKSEGEDPEISLGPKDVDNLYSWFATIIGPSDTPFSGGRFVLDIDIHENYPHYPPKVKFVTRIFHPNIHFKTGEVCLDILKTDWSPAWSIKSICRAILALLSHPEPESPLNCDSGNLLRAGDVRGFNSLAKMYTKRYAL